MSTVLSESRDSNGVVTERIVINDGATTRTTYDPQTEGVFSVELLTGPPIPEPAHAEVTLADVAAALRDPLANLTPTSASTTVRTAILNQRAALDALLAALETP